MDRSEWEWTRKREGRRGTGMGGEECLWDIYTWSSKHLPYSTMAMATVVPVGKSPKIPRYIILSLTVTVICSPLTVVPKDVNVHRRAWDLSQHGWNHSVTMKNHIHLHWFSLWSESSRSLMVEEQSKRVNGLSEATDWWWPTITCGLGVLLSLSSCHSFFSPCILCYSSLFWSRESSPLKPVRKILPLERWKTQQDWIPLGPGRLSSGPLDLSAFA